MKKHIIYTLAIALMTTLWNCGPLMDWLGEDMDEDVDVPQEFNPEKGKYYLFENEYPSDYEWDWQIFKDDTLMSVKDDTLRKQILCCVGLADDEKDCIVFKVDYDGNLINYGNLDTLYNVTYHEDKIVFWNIDGNIINTQEFFNNTTLNSSYSRGFIDNSLKVMEGIFNTKAVIDGGNTLKNHRFKKFGSVAITSGISMALPKPWGLVFSAGTEIVNHKIEENNKKTKKLLYGEEVALNINSVTEISEGILSVNVTIQNVHKIPKNLYSKKPACTPEENKNLITLGVLAKWEYIPYTDDYDYCSYEVPVNLHGDNEQTFEITLPRLKGGLQIIRPYIRAEINDIYTPILKNIDGDLVVYGEQESYSIQHLYISKVTPQKIIYDKTIDKYIGSYSIELVRNIGDLQSKKIISYGVYEEASDKTHPVESDGIGDKVYIQVYDTLSYIEPDYNNYTAIINKTLGTYMTTLITSKEPIIETKKFKYDDYELVFQLEEPTIEIKSVKLIETKEVYSTYGYDEVAVPAIGKESHFQVHVVSKCMPFGHESWMAGGEFYTIRGGTSTHPTPARLDVQNIAATIKEESKDNINFYYEVYVTKYHTDDNIGENPLYFGFESQFTETDSIVSKNYVKFNYVPNSLLDVDGGYKTAEIITGKMPDYVPKTIYSKEQ